MNSAPGSPTDRSVGDALPRPVRRAVAALATAVFLQWAGAGAILPLLPLYVRHRGGSDAVVGAVMAAFFVTAFACQYGAGRLSDRIGRLPLVLGGLLLYAAASLLFLLPGPVVVEVVYRGLQGAGAGGLEVAALAMITRAVPLSHRGRAVSRIYAGQLGGLAIGPLVGSLAGLGAMRWLFVAGAVASLAALGPVVLGHGALVEAAGDTRTGGTPADMDVAAGTGRGAGTAYARRALAGALLASSAVGVATGVYESCWTLLMTRHAASQWEIGLSWSLFCLPFAVLTRPAGWLADRFDRRWLGLVALGWSLLFCACYPFVPGVVPLLILGSCESLGWAVALPAFQSLLGEGTASQSHGRAQGLFASSETGMTGLASAAGGALFGVSAWIPFVGAAACGGLLLVAVALLWRQVPGRVAQPGTRRDLGLVQPGVAEG